MIEYILLHVCAPPTRRRDRSAATPGCGSSGEGPQQSWAPYWGDCSCIIFLVIYRSMTCSWSYKSTTQRSGLQGLNIHDCLFHRRKSSNSWCWTIHQWRMALLWRCAICWAHVNPHLHQVHRGLVMMASASGLFVERMGCWGSPGPTWQYCGLCGFNMLWPHPLFFHPRSCIHQCPSSKVRRSCFLCLLFTSGKKGKKAKASKKEKKGKETAPKKKEKDAKNKEEKPGKGKKEKTKDRPFL